MARRSTIQRKPKIVRTTKSEQYLVNKKYLGDEPIFTKPLTQVEYSRALTWYGYMCDMNDAREYLTEYLKNKGRLEDAKTLKGVADIWFPTTVAWIARLISRGCRLPVDTSGYMDQKIREALSKASSIKEDDDTPKVSIQDRMREKTHDIIGEVEGLIDDHLEANTNFSFYDWLTENNINPVYVGRIIEKLQPVMDELVCVGLNKDDQQLKEGYSHLTKKQLKDIVLFYKNMIDDAKRFSSNTKKTKAPRKPRVQSVEKKLKSFKYQKEDATFKIASIPPDKIIGAQELWFFSTKYKTLSVFRALDRGGLDVKGTSIIKYDENTSFTLRTGRKPEEWVKKVLEGGKIVLRKIDQELKNHAPLQTRCNENTILLRVI